MFENVICPDFAYEQLMRSGVVDRLLRKEVREKVADIKLYNCADMGAFEDIERFVASNRFKGKRNEKILMYEDLLRFKIDYDSKDFFHSDFESLLVKHPVYLGHVVLEDELLEYKKLGFRNRSDIEKAVTAFCLGERHEFGVSSQDEFVWRNNGYKNSIFRNIHGDLNVSQIDSSGKDYIDSTLFGSERVFDCIKDVEGVGFGAYQDWSEFLVSLLMYADKIGKRNIYQISNWEETLRNFGGGLGGAWTEAFGGHSSTELTAHILLSKQLLSSGEKLERMPASVYNRDQLTLPYFEEGKLIYLKESNEGDIEFSGRLFDRKRFSKTVEYDGNDLPLALIGTLKYFARSRELIPAIMNEFKNIGEHSFNMNR